MAIAHALCSIGFGQNGADQRCSLLTLYLDPKATLLLNIDSKRGEDRHQEPFAEG